MPSSTTETSPAWDPLSRTLWLMSPAWDPSSRTPWPMTPAYLPQDNHWLEDVALMCVRIKVRSLEDGPGGNVLEVMSMEMGCIKVRDRMRMQTVNLDSLAPLQPTSLRNLWLQLAGKEKEWSLKSNRSLTGSVHCVSQEHGSTRKHPTHDLVFLT